MPRAFPPATRVLVQFVVLASTAAAAIALLLISCHRNAPSHPINPSPTTYDQMVAAFSGAVCARQGCDTHRIPTVVPRPIQVWPDEPAAWLNMAVIHIRHGAAEIAMADKAIQKARQLAPENADVEYIHGMFEKQQYP